MQTRRDCVGLWKWLLWLQNGLEEALEETRLEVLFPQMTKLYAMDFEVLRQYNYPNAFSPDDKIKLWPPKGMEQDIAAPTDFSFPADWQRRQDCAIAAFLLERTPTQFVLLPPYAIEMEDFEHWAQIFYKHKKTRGYEKFGDFSNMLLTADPELTAIHSGLNKQAIIVAAEETLLPLMNEIRPNHAMRYANFIDSVALQFLFAFNERFAERREQEEAKPALMRIVSPSPAMKRMGDKVVKMEGCNAQGWLPDQDESVSSAVIQPVALALQLQHEADTPQKTFKNLLCTKVEVNQSLQRLKAAIQGTLHADEEKKLQASVQHLLDMSGFHLLPVRSLERKVTAPCAPSTRCECA